jgi:predicted ribosome quality control (RQC) complex YloA/Tae2 family protein
VSAFVQEADCAERVIVLKVRVPGRTSFAIVAAARGASGAGLLAQGLRQELWGAKLPPGAERQKAREESLEGAHLLGIGEGELLVDQRGDRRAIRVHNARVVIGDATTELPDFEALDDAARAAWETRGAALARAVAEDAIELRRADVIRLLERATQKIDRRAKAIAEDLAKIAEADTIAAQAQWLVAEAVRAPRGATKLVVTDWSSGEAVPIVIKLDPSKSAKVQVEAMFKRAKRLRLGGRIASDRLAQTEKQKAGVAEAIAKVRAAETLGAIEDAMRAGKSAAPRDVSLPGTAAAASPKGKGAGRRIPFRTFHARSGRRLLVGKGAADNDAVTQGARPHDLWLHAKDRTGAHVIAPLDKGETCPQEDLVDAAHLAAHFSDAREEKIVDVQYTQKRHLRKPKGSAPGFVIVDREKVLVLRVEPELLRTLLEREDA